MKHFIVLETSDLPVLMYFSSAVGMVKFKTVTENNSYSELYLVCLIGMLNFKQVSYLLKTFGH